MPIAAGRWWDGAMRLSTWRSPPWSGPRTTCAGTARAADAWWGLVTEGVAHGPDGPGRSTVWPARAAALAAELQSDRPVAERRPWPTRLVALLSAAGRAVVAAGHGPAAPGAGVVDGVFASGGGVPKAPVLGAAVGWRGARRRPPGVAAGTTAGCGRPCACGRPTWSTPWRPRATRSFPGAAGENVSVRGLDWAAVRPGVRLRLGSVRGRGDDARPPVRQERPLVRRRRLQPRCTTSATGPSPAGTPSVVEPGTITTGAPGGRRARVSGRPATVPAALVSVTTTGAARTATSGASQVSVAALHGGAGGDVGVDAAEAAGGGRPRVAAGHAGGLGPQAPGQRRVVEDLRHRGPRTPPGRGPRPGTRCRPRRPACAGRPPRRRPPGSPQAAASSATSPNDSRPAGHQHDVGRPVVAWRAGGGAGARRSAPGRRRPGRRRAWRCRSTSPAAAAPLGPPTTTSTASGSPQRGQRPHGDVEALERLDAADEQQHGPVAAARGARARPGRRRGRRARRRRGRRRAARSRCAGGRRRRGCAGRRPRPRSWPG